MYDYEEAVRDDIKDYILENYDRNDLADFDDEDDFKNCLIDIIEERFSDGDFEYFDCIVRCYIVTCTNVIEDVVDELLEENNDFIIEWNEAHRDEEEGLDD